MVSSIQNSALNAINRGWNPIPLKVRSKRASKPWKEFQDRRVNKEEIQELFPDNEANGVILVAGSAKPSVTLGRVGAVFSILDSTFSAGGFTTAKSA